MRDTPLGSISVLRRKPEPTSQIAQNRAGFRLSPENEKANGWRANNASGFTLVEMMVALFIFGMIASASVFLLRQSVEAEARSAVRLDEMGDLRRFAAIMAQDMTLALPRPSRDAIGSDRVALMTGDGLLIGFTRQVPQIDPQPGVSSLQRVEWALSDGRLTRAIAPKADGAATTTPVPILEGIESVQLRFRDKQGLWQPDWRPQRTDELPIAIELTLAQAGNPGAPLVLQFLVAGGGE